MIRYTLIAALLLCGCGKPDTIETFRNRPAPWALLICDQRAEVLPGNNATADFYRMEECVDQGHKNVQLRFREGIYVTDDGWTMYQTLR